MTYSDNFKIGSMKDLMELIDAVGFDTIITRLQKLCYVIISDFRYEVDKTGKEYGWGIAEYSEL